MLAQILAILSGTWIVGSGIYASTSSHITQMRQNLLTFTADTIYNNDLYTGSSFANITTPMRDSFSEGAAVASDYSKTLFGWGIGFGLAAIVVWFIGSMRPRVPVNILNRGMSKTSSQSQKPSRQKNKYVYLDTNVFSLVADRQKLVDRFSVWCKMKNLTLVISESLIDELSRKSSKIGKFNALINNGNINKMFLGAYSRITGLEFKHYPKTFDIMEISLTPAIEHLLKGRPFDLAELREHQGFMQSVRIRSDISKNDFRETIERMRQMYMPQNGESYTNQEKTKIAEEISNNVRKHIIKETGIEDPKMDYFRTRTIIPQALFRKYLFNRSRKFDPNDFLDITHIAYSPYMDIFITEADNADVLRQIKEKTNLLDKTAIRSYTDFKKILESP